MAETYTLNLYMGSGDDGKQKIAEVEDLLSATGYASTSQMVIDCVRYARTNANAFVAWKRGTK